MGALSAGQADAATGITTVMFTQMGAGGGGTIVSVAQAVANRPVLASVTRTQKLVVPVEVVVWVEAEGECG